jgi:CHAT domain-containing protein/Tfp pilus assembly protein PilF
MSRFQFVSVVPVLIVFAAGVVAQDSSRATDNAELIAAYNRGETLKQQGKTAEAVKEYEKVVTLAVRVLGPEDAKTAIVINNLGQLYDALGQFAKAEPLFQRSLEILEKRVGKNHPDYATTLWNLARNYDLQGNYARSEPLYRQVVEIRKQVLGEKDPRYVETLAQLAEAYFHMGNPSKAVLVFGQVQEVCKNVFGEKSLQFAGSLHNTGMMYHYLGDYARAEPLLRQSAEIHKQVRGEKDSGYASTLSSMARLYYAQGDYARAEPLFRQVVEIRKQLVESQLPPGMYGKRERDSRQFGLAVNLRDLAELYFQQKDYSRAEPLVRQALEIVKQIEGVNQVSYAPILNDLARLYHAQGDFLRAEPLYRQALDSYLQKLNDKHFLYADTLNNLARLYQDQGDYPRAEPLFREALAIRKQSLGDKHPDYATTLENLACLCNSTNRSQEAWNLANRSMEIRQYTLHSLFAFTSESTMRAHLDSIGPSLPIFLSHSLDERLPRDTSVSMALTWALRRKGILLDTVCRFRQSQRELGNNPALAQKAARWRFLRQQLADLPLKGTKQDDPQAVQKQIQAWQNEAEQLEADLNRALSEQHEGAAGDTDTQKVQRKLAAGAALLEFVRADLYDFKATGKQPRWKPPRYFAFVLSASKDAPPRLIDLGRAEPIDQAIRKLRQQIEAAPRSLRLSSEKDVEAEFRTASKDLHRLVFGPLREALGKATLVYVAPDGELNRVAFEALLDDKDRYLIESYRFAYLSCGRDLIRPNPKPASGTVVFAGPDFDLNAKQRKEQVAALAKQGDQIVLRGSAATEMRGLRWTPLPGAAAEAADIEKALQGSAYGPVQTYSGAKALEDVFKRIKAPRVLHLATHGFFLEDVQRSPGETDRGLVLGGEPRGWERLRTVKNPLLRSGIVLAGANALGEQTTIADVDDGWVTAEEIALMNLQGTDLVVLSACESGLGDIKTGEGVYGLRRAFLYAGARTLVTSLYKVPDNETRQMMQRFYGSLKAGKSKLEALHDAQLAVIQQRRKEHGAAHPFFWASFVLVGDPGAVPAEALGPPESQSSTSAQAKTANTGPLKVAAADPVQKSERPTTPVAAQGGHSGWLWGGGFLFLLIGAAFLLVVWKRSRVVLLAQRQPDP